MNDTPDPAPEGALRLLKWLVIGLTATMLAGLIVLIALFVTRFPAPATLSLPAAIDLPEGATATAFTRGPDWLAVVTDAGEILIFSADGHSLKRTIAVE